MNAEQKNAIEYIDENAGIFTGVSDAVWAKPELSLKEFESTRLYCETLRSHGFEVTEGLCGIATAFCGSYGSGRPVVGHLKRKSIADGATYTTKGKLITSLLC